MKKNLLIIIGLLCLFNLNSFASNRYWVGGSGAWSDPLHWSAMSGGAGGAIVPTINDDVFFDIHSFTNVKQVVRISSDVICHNINWSSIDKQEVLAGPANKKLTVNGSLTLSPFLICGFKGQIEFNSTSSGNTISTLSSIVYSNWIFNGSGSWILNDELTMASNASISLLKGNLNTNDKRIVCGSFIGNSNQERNLDLGHSEVVVKKIWDFSVPSHLVFNADNSSILFTEPVGDNNFKPGGLRYGGVSVSPLSQNTVTCVFPQFTITLTADSVRCNALSDGAAHAVITGGSGSPVYDWNFGATPVGDFTSDITNLGASTNTVKVTEVIAGVTVIHFCSISVGEPPPLNDYQSIVTTPTCFGVCNGFMDVDETGGTPPYTYTWAGIISLNDSVSNVCAGTYTATVIDARGCRDSSAVVTVGQPTLLVAPGNANMVSCNGLCNGSAIVNPSGGTAPYSYSWSPAPPSGQGTSNIINLCAPSSYTVTVTDSNGCLATFDTAIIQPPVLTLTLTHVNATCGGTCNGTATATISGGTSPYIYSWSNGSITNTASTTNTISSLCAGSYTVIVTDANGCSKTDSVIITEPLVLVATAIGNGTSCFGICDGTAAAVVSGGTVGAGYNYAWTPGTPVGDGTANISVLCPGTYTVLVTDVNGCNDTGTVAITEPALLIANPSSNSVLCFGNLNGSATANPTGGSLPYIYDWNGAATPTGDGTDSISGLSAGNYCVHVTDAHGCDTIQCVTVIQPPALTVSITKTNVKCNGACNGTAKAHPAGGTPGYTYFWAGPGALIGQGTDSLSSLCPGTYTVTITDANGCTKTATTTITQPNVLNATLSFTPLLCNGDCNSTITSTVSGGTPPYSFSWAPAGSTASITNQCAGPHTLTVTDSKGCIKVVSITVTQPTALTAITSQTNVSCFGQCNGTASVIAGGGTPGYTYLWSPGSFTTSTITNLCTGSYTVTVKDANNCTITSTVTITSPPQLFGNPSVSQNVLCSGQCNGIATSSATGGSGSTYTYNWLPGNPAGDGTPTITGLCPGSYTLITTDSLLCTSSQSVTITQPSPLTAPITGSTSSCNVCNGTATVTPSGGTAPYSYLWNDGQTTPTAIGLCPLVTYTVVVTDANLCTATTSVTIAQTITITITTSNTTLSCSGACDGAATANPSGGQTPYTYLWVGSSGSVGVGGTVTNLCAGTYSVTVVDSNGCINTDTVAFSNPPILNVTATHTNASCGGTCDGTATGTATGGTGAYSYSWSTLPVQTTQTASGLCAGSYTLTVTDSSGCTDTVSVIITEPPIIVDNPTINNAACLLSDGSISVAPTGGAGGPYTYLWSGPGLLTGQGTPNLTNLFPGAYDLTITTGVCSYTFNYLISNTTGPTLVMAHSNMTCNSPCNGTASVTASGGAGGYIYDWTPGAPSGDLTDSIFSLCGTLTYTVQVTDASGCITIDTAKVIKPALISPNQVVTNETCGGLCNGTITLNPTGGTGTYSYQLNGAAATANMTGLCAGSYNVTITDLNLCDTTFTVNITAPPVLSVSLASTNVLCFGTCTGTATATATGGAGGVYTYDWSHDTTLVLANVVNLCPGSYTVTVGNGTGCTATDSVTITQPPLLTTITSQTNASCNGTCDGTATVIPSGGTLPYQYLWNDPAATTNNMAINLCFGTYIVTVTDSNGCMSSPSPVNITQPSAIIPNVTFTNPTCNSFCNGTAISAVTGGTAPYTYDWSGTPSGDGTAAVTNICAGPLTLVITDSLGCSNNQTINLIAPPALSANPTSVSPTCMNSCNGSVNASPAGGTPGYTYSWSPGGATSQAVINLCPAVYTVIVSDTNNCKDTANITVINPAPINIAVSSTPANCGVCDGTITVTPITGVGPYTYVWTPAPTIGQGTPNADSVCAGLYDVLVTSAAGCDSTFTIPMNNSGGADSAIVSTIDVTCNSFCNGSGSVVPIGGVSPFTYLWNDGPPPTANDSAANLCAGNYFVEITDSNACIHFAPVTINEPAPILSNPTITNSICSNVCNGIISLAPSGGTPGPGYTYFWTPGSPAGQGTSTITGLCSGTYSVVITDNNGCTKVDSFTVSQSAPLIVTVGSTNMACSAVCNGTAFVTITSGTAPFVIIWNDPFSQTNDTASALCAGAYSAIVTDVNGCTQTINTTITSTPPLAGNVTTNDATCGVCDGTAMAAPSGGTAPYTFLWSNSQTGTNATGLCSGLYSVDITDSAGCISSFSAPISSIGGPTSLAITSSNILCNGDVTGAVTSVVPSGGVPPYSYFWIGLGLTTPTLSGLTAGTYYIQVTDSSGCSIVDSVTITEPAPILANQVIVPPTCGMADGTITIAPSGGTSPYTILWNTGATGLSITDSAGAYSVQITDFAGCSVNILIPLSNINGPSVGVTSQNVSCNGFCNGSSIASASGGVAPYTYLWNDVSAQITPTASSLCPGNYAVEVTGADGCISVALTSISEPPVIGSSVSNVVDPLCNGGATGSITVIPTGGTLPYIYSWSPSGGTGATASGLVATSYTVTVTDAQGCALIQTFTLTENAALIISSAVTNPSCNTLSDGAIDVTVAGGTSTYSYIWSSSATTEDLSGLSAGSYTVNVTDGNGCMIADTSLLIPNQTVLVSAGNDTSFCQNGALTLSASSAAGITYQWFQLPANTAIGSSASVIVTPPAGTTSYYVIANNGSGCTANDSITVSSNVIPVASAGSDATIITGTSTVIGGNPTGSSGTTIMWSPLPGLDNATASNPTAAPTATTVYTVTVTTAAGCSASDSVIVTVLPTIVIPDGISPNADGDNDEWVIDGIELFPKCSVEVYNRWGELLFQSAGYKEHWKGKFKGKDLPVGTYYYIIDLKDPLFPDVYTGPITILR